MAKRSKRTTTKTPQRGGPGAKIVSEGGKLPARATAAELPLRRVSSLAALAAGGGPLVARAAARLGADGGRCAVAGHHRRRRRQLVGEAAASHHERADDALARRMSRAA